MNKTAPMLFGSIVVAATTALVGAACAGEVMVDGRPCPCTQGWVCCEAQNMCVGPGSTCPKSTVDSGGVIDGDGGDGGVASRAGVVLASKQYAVDIAIDDTNVYWASVYGEAVYGGSGVHKVAKSGGEPVFINGEPLAQRVIGVDSTSIYFTQIVTAVSARSIIAVPISGGPSRMVVVSALPGVEVLMGGDLYLAGSQRMIPADDGGFTFLHEAEAFKVSVAGGTPTSLPLPAVDVEAYVSDPRSGTLLDGGVLSFPAGNWSVFRGSASSDAVYVSMQRGEAGEDRVAGGILRLPLDGGAITFLPVPGIQGPVAVDESNVYFDGGWAGLQKMPKMGGPRSTLAEHEYPRSLALDDAFVYFMKPGEKGHDAIRKVPKDGGPVVDVVGDQDDVAAIAVDATSVYWSSLGDGTIRKIAK